jgi:hypothetical protein
MTSPRRRKSPTLSLKLGEETFRVERKNLFENLGLFQGNPSLLFTSDYEVRTAVPRDLFAAFVSIIEGSSITLSEENYESFGLLSLEFRFEALSDACSAFMARERSKPELSSGKSNRKKISVGPGHKVTITAFEHSKTYEILRSLDEIRSFAIDLEQSKAGDIVIDVIDGSDDVVAKAIAAVLSNAAVSLPDDHTKLPFLVMTLWEMRKYLRFADMNSVMYCLDQIREMAPTTFDLARLLLLSQCDPDCRHDFVPLPTADRDLIRDAIEMLKHEKNSKTREARGLLRRLKASGRYGFVMWN